EARAAITSGARTRVADFARRMPAHARAARQRAADALRAGLRAERDRTFPPHRAAAGRGVGLDARATPPRAVARARPFPPRRSVDARPRPNRVRRALVQSLRVDAPAAPRTGTRIRVRRARRL